MCSSHLIKILMYVCPVIVSENIMFLVYEELWLLLISSAFFQELPVWDLIMGLYWCPIAMMTMAIQDGELRRLDFFKAI